VEIYFHSEGHVK